MFANRQWWEEVCLPPAFRHIAHSEREVLPASIQGWSFSLKADPPSSCSQSTWTPARLSERIWLMEWSPTCLGIHLKLGRISILWGVCVCVQLCPTLCDLMGCKPSRLLSVHGILQAGILEWVAISYSRESSQPRNRTHISCAGRQIL